MRFKDKIKLINSIFLSNITSIIIGPGILLNHLLWTVKSMLKNNTF